ncbi:MAG: polyprenyl synthetase family protein [Alphaproteobacteria bacterium]
MVNKRQYFLMDADKLKFLSPLHCLQATLAPEMALVDALIEKRTDHGLTLIPQVCRHLIFAGGKRLRPLLTLACAKLHEDSCARAIALAAAVEFIHTATLLHDDVVDESTLRRGRKTANSVWGNSISILVGDFLITQAFSLMVEDGDANVLHLLSETTQKIVEGEVQQIQAGSDLTTPVDEFLQIIAAKTASLFGASCQVGGMAAGHPLDLTNNLYDFGRYLGTTFQLVDDILDYTANNRGKAQGDDFLGGKVTIPVLFAYQRGTPQEKLFWERTICDRHTQEQDFLTALTIIQPYLSQTLALAKEYANKAIQSLAGLEASALKDNLVALTYALCDEVQLDVQDDMVRRI